MDLVAIDRRLRVAGEAPLEQSTEAHLKETCAALLAPIVAAHDIGRDRIGLADVVALLPGLAESRAAGGFVLDIRRDAVWIERAETWWAAPVEGADGTVTPGTRRRPTEVRDVMMSDLASIVARAVGNGQSAGWSAEHRGLKIDVALAPEADGGATLSLLPPVEEEPVQDLLGRMEAAAREVLVRLMGVPFAEERKEEIAHRLVGPERTTTLLVGWSLVLPRNRRVFAAWLGSDGRVMIRLFPPEGRPARGRA